MKRECGGIDGNPPVALCPSGHGLRGALAARAGGLATLPSPPQGVSPAAVPSVCSVVENPARDAGQGAEVAKGVGRLLAKALFLMVLVTLTYALVLCGLPVGRSDVMLAILDKHQALRTAGSPTLVCVGGSCVAFGLDSPRLEERLGYSVVNMGLNMSLGLRYMLEEIKPSLKTGDVVLVVPEYHQFTTDLNGGGHLVRLVEVFPKGIRYLTSAQQYFTLCRYAPRIVQGKLERFLGRLAGVRGGPEPPLCYTRDGFNRNGDVIAELTNRLESDSPLDAGPDLELGRHARTVGEAVRVLNDFHAYARRRGVGVFLIYPTVSAGYYAAHRDEIEAIARRIESEVTLPILASPRDCVFPREQMFDTVYHLNADGRRVRTDQIVSLLATVGVPGSVTQVRTDARRSSDL